MKPTEHLNANKLGNANRGRGKRSWLTKFREPGDIVLHITGGLIAHYRDRGNVKVSVYKIGGASETGERQTLVATDETVSPNGKQHTIRLAIKDAGLYRIDVDDGMDMTEVTWPDSQPMAWKLSLEDHPRMFTGRWNLWFYVPEGTKKVGLYVDTGGGQIIDPNGEIALKLEQLSGRYVSVDVPAGYRWPSMATESHRWKGLPVERPVLCCPHAKPTSVANRFPIGTFESSVVTSARGARKFVGWDHRPCPEHARFGRDNVPTYIGCGSAALGERAPAVYPRKLSAIRTIDRHEKHHTLSPSCDALQGCISAAIP